MDFIDEKGRLFGVVNVVDALVVLVVLAMVVAGVALLTGGDDADTAPEDPEPQRYAVVAFDVPTGSDAATLSADERLATVSGDESYDVTDVYRGFTPGGNVYVVAKVGYRGELTGGGSTLYGGDSVDLTTGSYRVTGAVLGVNRTDDTIPTATRRVVLTANVSSTVGMAIEEGQTATIGDERVATVTALDRRGVDDDRMTVRVGANLTVWDSQPVAAFDGQPLRVGNRVTLVTDDVTIPGRVGVVGTDDPDEVETG